MPADHLPEYRPGENESDYDNYWGEPIEKRYVSLFKRPAPLPLSTKEIHHATGIYDLTIIGMELIHQSPVDLRGFSSERWKLYKIADETSDPYSGFRLNGIGNSGQPESIRVVSLVRQRGPLLPR